MTPRRALQRHLHSLRRSTRLIARSLDRLGSELRRLERDAKRKPKAASAKRQLRITPKRRAQLKLQGDVMDSSRNAASSVAKLWSPELLTWGGGAVDGAQHVLS